MHLTHKWNLWSAMHGCYGDQWNRLYRVWDPIGRSSVYEWGWPKGATPISAGQEKLPLDNPEQAALVVIVVRVALVAEAVHGSCGFSPPLVHRFHVFFDRLGGRPVQALPQVLAQSVDAVHFLFSCWHFLAFYLRREDRECGGIGVCFPMRVPRLNEYALIKGQSIFQLVPGNDAKALNTQTSPRLRVMTGHRLAHDSGWWPDTD